ncbi:MAG TPA: GNAT family N-acetyltransferase [Ramlibacter sp.]|uniref:GNAT family N-acetyltransferase n=1 Tax=Ramlibacter sp. TaxID=1917967 RepID=UPI002D8074A5|nr:GNAT family N-acetyltransferase [Ramlibacter sp.]HET8747403.1 GNAT family N-acetyltransferase [Ramlibacter sp.]
MLTIAPLANHQELVPLLCGWFRDEWPEWYGPDGPGDAAADVSAFAASETCLPVGLVAFEDTNPVGVAALKSESLPTHKHLTPWAAAGLVLPSHRGRGIGHQLLGAVVKHARHLGFERVYCGTATAVTLLRRSGWSELEVVEHEGHRLAIFETRTAV